jgi:hypothetical protein
VDYFGYFKIEQPWPGFMSIVQKNILWRAACSHSVYLSAAKDQTAMINIQHSIFNVQQQFNIPGSCILLNIDHCLLNIAFLLIR